MPRTKLVQINEDAIDEALIEEAGELIRSGGLVAFPTETVYGLGGNALDAAASGRIYAAKGRPSDNPLIIHIAERSALDAIVRDVPERAVRLADAYWPGPLTMIFFARDNVPRETTGGLSTVAVRYPSNKIANALIRAAGGYVAAPSANASGRPSPTTAAHVAEDLDGRIEMIIDGGAVEIGLESTIVDFTVEPPTVLRPGYIGREAISQVIGEVVVDPATQGDHMEAAPKAPGMKYKHYAPRADLTIIAGGSESVSARIRAYAEAAKREGKRVGILCAEETKGAYPQGEVIAIGTRGDEESIARSLYAALRRFDELETDCIFSESFDTPRLGEAIMNRLRKAAGGRIEYI